MTAHFIGTVTSGGRRSPPQRLEDRAELVRFIKANLYEDEVVVTDAGDNLLFRALDGVDVYSALHKLGIDLPALYGEAREALVAAESEPGAETEPWEELYDSVGLSPGEIAMRQRVKRACKAARTVADVAELLEGTYFDAYFYSQDRSRAWRYFDPRDYSAWAYETGEEEDLSEEQERSVQLDPDARVRHVSSGEDIHTFILLDPPEE